MSGETVTYPLETVLKETKDRISVNAQFLVFIQYWQPTLEKRKIRLEITTELLTERVQHI